MKRQLSSFDFYVITKELQEFVGYYIEKIYHLTRNELLIRIKNITKKQKINIFIRNGELISISEKKFETPKKPSNFAMTLRKYLENGKITEITQHEFDRVIKLKIHKKEGDYFLIIEFFSDGNMILVDQNSKIIYPLITKQWAHRAIRARRPYIPPPSQINPFNLSFEEFLDILRNSKADLVRTMAVNINLSGSIAEEICIRANVDKNSKIEDFKDSDLKIVFSEFSNFIKIFEKGDFSPTLVKEKNKPIDIIPFEFKSYNLVNSEKVDSFLGGLERFISSNKSEKREISKVDKKIGKLKRQLKQQNNSIVDLDEKIGKKKFEGDLIYLNFQKCEDLLREINEVLQLKEKEEKIKSINDLDFVENFDPVSNNLVVILSNTDGDSFKVKLDFRKSVAENAEKAYDDCKKFRNKKIGALESIEVTKKQLTAADKEKDYEDEKKKMIKVNARTFWFERFRWFISSDGNIVVGGRDAKTNEVVVKKYLKEGCRYAHADVHGAPSCVICNRGVNDENITISNESMEEVCIFAACYSKAWNQFVEAQSYWVLPEQVSRTPQSGEFLPKGAFIIRGKRNYYRCKLELAVGEVEIGDDKKIMCGPVDSVKKRSEKIVVFVPGDMKKNDFSHKLSKVFKIPVDQFERVLPSGGISVVEAVGCTFE